MSDHHGLLPEHEGLRRAVRAIAEEYHGRCDRATLDAVSLRFDLSPQDEEFLLRHFLVRDAHPSAPLR